MQAYNRDERTDAGNAIKSLFASSGTQWSSAMSKNLEELSKEVGAKKGSKAVDDYLKKYDQRQLA